MSRHRPNPKPRPSTDTGAQQLARAYTLEAIEALAHIIKHGQSEQARVTAANSLLAGGTASRRNSARAMLSDSSRRSK